MKRNKGRSEAGAPRCCCNPDEEVDPAAGRAGMLENGDEGLVLDVRRIPPALKHPTIFRVFDELREDECFVLLNDHDPVPLHRQFERMRPGRFRWTYLERGPAVWRVEIDRIRPDGQRPAPFEKTVNEVVRDFPGSLPVLDRYGIDTCCGGDLPLREAARRHGVTWEAITAEIEAVIDRGATAER